jgi:hypothetical protein
LFGKSYTQGTNGCFTATGTALPNGIYTQFRLLDGCVVEVGSAPTPTIDFGQSQTWCSLGVSYTYTNGKITKTGTAIPDGTYTRFTIQNGCIVGADSASLPVYQPAECCDSGSGGSGSTDCGDVFTCLASAPSAGQAGSTTKLIGADGNAYTLPSSTGGGSGSFDCDDVKECLSAFQSNGAAGALTFLIGADGFKYSLPSGSATSGADVSSCGGLQISGGLVKSVPATIAATDSYTTEFGWGPVLGASTTVNDFLKVTKSSCKLNFSIDAAIFNAKVEAAVSQRLSDLEEQVAALANQQACIGLVSARQSGPITSNYIIEVSGVAPNSTLTLTGWNITSFTTDATGYGITQAQLAVTEGCGTISHPTCGLVVAGGSVNVACVNGSGGGGSTTADYWAFVSGSCQLNPAVSAGTTTYATQAACNAANPPADYWAYSVTLGICQLNPVLVGGTPTYATQALCNAANGI